MKAKVSTKFLILAAFCATVGFSGGSIGSPGSQPREKVSSHKRSVGWRRAVCSATNFGNQRPGMLLVFSHGRLSGAMRATQAGPAPSHSTPSIEEIAVYKAFVAYSADRVPDADVADLTYPISVAEQARCLRGIKLEKSEGAAVTVQMLPPEILPDTGKFRIVTIRSSSEQHERLLRLSAIAFDSRHHAVLNYSYRCGVLCGEGGTVVFEKLGGRWKYLRFCKEWVS